MAATNIVIGGEVALVTGASGTIVLGGTPLLTATGITVVPVAAQMDGAASITFTGGAHTSGFARMDGVATVALIGTTIASLGAAHADGAGQVAFVGSVVHSGAAQMNGAASMLAASVPPPVPAIAQMDGAASMIATGAITGRNVYNAALVERIVSGHAIKSLLRMHLNITHAVQLADRRVLRLVQKLRESFKLTDRYATNTRYHYVFTAPIGVRPTLSYGVHAITNLVESLILDQTTSPKFIWGRILKEVFKVSAVASAVGAYKKALAQLFKLSDIEGLRLSHPVALSQNINLSLSLAHVTSLKLLQKFLVATASSPVLHYHLALIGRVAVEGILDHFARAILTQLFTVHPALGRQFTANGSLSQLLTISPALTNKLILEIVESSNFVLDSSQLVHMIYKGDPLLDGVAITALYVSPSGTTTTWAVNTRTNAVTEYLNYDFRSFAMMGNRYVAAGSDGLYELDGDTDDGELIISELMSGYLQLNEKKMFGIKGAYVAIRGGGRFYLKLVSGDGREYIYELRAQPNLMTTKVKVGKGLKTTYLAFDLVTEGQDFDLDSIEFIPMTSGRRV